MERALLPNGLQVTVSPLSTAEVVSVAIALRAGAVVESEATDGVAHLLEHMVFKGTAEQASGYAFWQELLDSGAYFNGSTTEDAVVYYFSVSPEQLEHVLQLYSAAVREPALRENELPTERDVVLAEFDLKTSPRATLRRFAGELMYGPAVSRIDVLGSGSRRSCPLFSWMTSARRLPGCGPEIAFGWLSWGTSIGGRYFDCSRRDVGPLAEAGSRPAPVPPTPKRTTNAEVMQISEAATWHVSAYFGAPAPGHRDHASLLLGLSILRERLWRRIREEAGLAYYVHSGLLTRRNNAGYLDYASLHPLRALRIARRTTDDFVAEGPSDAELNGSRRRMATRLALGLQSPLHRARSILRWKLSTGEVRTVHDQLQDLAEVRVVDALQAVDTYVRDLQIAAAGDGVQFTSADLISGAR